MTSNAITVNATSFSSSIYLDGFRFITVHNDDSKLNIYDDNIYVRITDCLKSETPFNIPSDICGWTVRQIRFYAFDNRSFANVTIPDSVTYIGAYAFNNCTNLKNVIIPSHVAEIGENAFGKCTSLESVIIPDDVILRENAFDVNCNVIRRSEATPKISISDVVYLKKFLVNIQTEYFEKYDLNNDGFINVFDMIILRRSVLAL